MVWSQRASAMLHVKILVLTHSCRLLANQHRCYQRALWIRRRHQEPGFRTPFARHGTLPRHRYQFPNCIENRTLIYFVQYFMVDLVVNHYAWSGAPDTVDYSTFGPFNNQNYFHQYCAIDFNDISNTVCRLNLLPVSIITLRRAGRWSDPSLSPCAYPIRLELSR